MEPTHAVASAIMAAAQNWPRETNSQVNGNPMVQIEARLGHGMTHEARNRAWEIMENLLVDLPSELKNRTEEDICKVAVEEDEWEFRDKLDYNGFLHEYADRAVPVTTDEIWEQFLGFKAWRVSDAMDLCDSTNDDMERMAQIHLYVVYEIIVCYIIDLIARHARGYYDGTVTEWDWGLGE